MLGVVGKSPHKGSEGGGDGRHEKDAELLQNHLEAGAKTQKMMSGTMMDDGRQSVETRQ